MIRDITIGQYYPAQSPIHRLDPRVKIVCTLIFLVSLFVQNSVLGYALAFVFLACMQCYSIGESLRSQRQDFVLLCSWQFVLYCLLQDLL